MQDSILRVSIRYHQRNHKGGSIRVCDELLCQRAVTRWQIQTVVLADIEIDGDPDAEALASGDLIIIHAKWTIDGAATLEEAARKAEKFAMDLRGLVLKGYVLESPVSDDYGYARRKE